MRKVGLCLSVLAVALFASQAFAFTTDGNWSDWFTYHGNPSLNDWQQGNYTLTNLNIRRLADEEGPTPGGGGQPFDIEEILYFWDDFDPEDGASGGIIRVGLVTGFNSAGVNVSGTWYYAGDMFFDFGNTGGYDAAVGVGTENTVQNNGGARFGNAWGNSGVPNWTLQGVVVPAYSDSNPYRVDENAPGAIPLPGAATVAWGGMGVHNFLEIALTVDGGIEGIITDEENGGLGLHWTMLCGNDVIDVRDDTPLVPVPEPSTAIVLGMGVLGALLRCRRPVC